MTAYLTAMDSISLSRTVFEIFDFKVFRDWPWPLTPKGHLGSKNSHNSKSHIWLPIWLLWTPSLYPIPFSRYSTSKFLGFDLDLWPLKVIWGPKKFMHSKGQYDFLTYMDSISLSRTVFEIFDFNVFRVWPWPLTPKSHLGSKKFIPFERPYMTSYLTSMDTISLSHTDLEIFHFKVFRVWPWPLTPKGHLGVKKNVCHSKGHIWLPIWLLWTSSLYLVPFSRYSTSKFLGFDLDLWPLKVIRGQKNLYHSKGHIWLPIWLLWAPSLYLVPFSRYSTSKFLGFDLDLWPLKVIWGQKNVCHSKGHIWLPIWLLWTHLSISYRFRDIRLQSF